MEFLRRSSRIATHASLHALGKHFAKHWIYDKISALHIIRKPMALASARTNPWNNTSGFTAAQSRTVGTLGCHSHNIQRTLGHLPLQRKHLSTF
jgi:hypothetical protein